MVDARARGIQSFLKSARVFYYCNTLDDANAISSHTLYKAKQNGNVSLKLKARNALHGDQKNDLENTFSMECAPCPPTGLRVLKLLAFSLGWARYKANIKTAFLHSGAPESGVYVRPPVESRVQTTHVWILLTAVYGLFNVNVK